RQLVLREAHRLTRRGLGNTRQLEHHATRLHHRDPVLRIALAGTHAGLGRLLGDGLVGEDVDPHLPTSLDVAGHRDTSGLDLPVGDPTWFEGLDPVVAEVDLRTALGGAGHPAPLHLAVADLARHEHWDQSSSPWNLGASWCWRVRRSISSSSAR